MLTAYELNDDAKLWRLEPAPPHRAWMETPGRQAYRCLPLTIANQAGWVLRLPGALTAYWNGDPAPEGLSIFLTAEHQHLEHVALSHFGNGIITFSVPLLFRTHEGALRVAGLPNEPVYNCHPLEGIVETDWLPFTFTMNWKIVRPHIPVHFAVGDPICFVQPIDLELLEYQEPRRKPLADNPKLARQYAAWAAARTEFNAAGHPPEAWQKFYHKGGAGVTPPPDHRTSLNLKPFRS